VNKLDKLRAALLPAVEFLFGEASADSQFEGFDVRDDIAKPNLLLDETALPRRYRIQIPARSFTNDVMLLADVIQEMVRGLAPVDSRTSQTNALYEGAAIYGATMAIRQVFGEETLDSYLDALRTQAFAYYDAFSYVAVLLTDDPQAIKKLRHIQPCLYRAEKADFDNADVIMDRKIKDILLFAFRA
jgi:hypothetical protein